MKTATAAAMLMLGLAALVSDAQTTRAIEPKQTSTMPAVNTDYTLAGSDIYKGNGQGEPAQRDPSIAWRRANEFVYRTALAGLCKLPGSATAPEQNGFVVSFGRQEGKGDVLVFATASSPTVKWLGIGSTPSATNGLQVSVRLPKPVYAAAGPLDFLLHLENVSDKPFMLYDADFWLDWQMIFDGQGTAGYWRVGVDLDYKHLPSLKTLKPGEACDVPVKLDQKVYPFVLQSKDAAQRVAQLPPGKYDLAIEFTLDAPAPNKAADRPFDFWTGRVKTEPVTLEISDKAAATTRTSQP